MNLTTLQSEWQDTPAYHEYIHDLFSHEAHSDTVLNNHREWVKSNVFGFGEDSFHYLWKILLVELPTAPTLLEIGVFRGQVLSLWKLLRPDAKVFGVTPMDNSGGMWESDYAADIKHIHDIFNLPQPHIFHGRSDDSDVIAAAEYLLYDVVYIDGGHEYETALFDLNTYSKMVKVGGYLVIDDANCDLNFPPSGYFTGIQSVTDAKLAWLENEDNKWKFVGSVVHIAVYRRVK